MAVSSRYSAIVGIDFGTTRSGYHFAFTSKPDQINPNEDWRSALPGGKTLTEILLNKNDFSVVAFGYEARNAFANGEDKSNFAYFSNFKTVLHNKEGTIRETVKAINCDVSIPTVDLISICLRFIKDKAISQLRSSKTVELDETKICWVITVPAIWDMPARLAMRNAARKAGMPVNNIEIALEPEAAVLCCLENEPEMKDAHSTAKNDFMVVDAGGGTVDITVHRNKSGNGLVELHSPSGGMWGSSHINLKFEELIEELLGKDHVSKMKGLDDWISMMDYFETTKVNFDKLHPGGYVPISAVVPEGLADANLSSAIEAYNNRHGTTLKIGRGKMLQLGTTMPNLFEPLVTSIVGHISNLLALPGLENVKFLFLVGGFAHSPLLREQIEQAFHDRVKVIVPPQPGLSVMTGAVRFGFDPSFIKERIVQQTIGIEYSEVWDDTKHAGKLQTLGDNKAVVCAETVLCFVHCGDTISTNHKVAHAFPPLTSRQKSIEFKLFASSKRNIYFSSDAGARYIGRLLLDIPDSGAPAHTRMTDVTMLFGGTTFAVSATYRKTGKTTSAQFDLILDNTRPGNV